MHNPFPRLYIAAAVIQCSYVVSDEPFPAQVGYQFSCADFPVTSLDCTASEIVIIIIIFLAHQHKVIINSVNLLPCWRSFHRHHQVYMIRAYIEH